MSFRLRRIDPEGDGEVYIIQQDFTTIGRGTTAEIQINSASVSRIHTVLIYDNSTSELLIRDENSTNGTFVNSKQVVAPIQLAIGDVIQLGVIQFVVEEPAAFRHLPSQEELETVITSFKPSKRAIAQLQDRSMTDPIPRKQTHLPERRGSRIGIGNKNHNITRESIENAKAEDIITFSSMSDLRRTADSDISPFAVAVLANNQQAAIQILYHLSGTGDLSNCNLNQVPSCLVDIVKGQYVNTLILTGNPITELPLEFRIIPTIKFSRTPLADKYGSWAKYKKSLKKKATKIVSRCFPIVCVFGGKGTGKTSLVKSLVSGKCRSVKRQTFTKQTECKKLQCIFNDLGNVEINTPAHLFYLSPVQLYIITVNLKLVDLADIEYWRESIKRYGGTAVVVATHSDGIPPPELEATLDFLEQKIFPKSGYEFIQGIFPVNCRSGTGIPELTRALRTLIAPRSEDLPSISFQFRRFAEDLSAPYVDWANCSAQLTECGVKPPNQKEILYELQSVGALSCFHGFESNVVFLDHQAIPVMIHQIQQSAVSFLTARNVLEAVLWRYAPIFDYLLTLFDKYQIIYWLSRLKQYFIPYLLPLTRPTSEISAKYPPQFKEKETCFGRVFQFLHHPRNLMQHIQSAVLNLTYTNLKEHVLWRNGMLLQLDGCTVLTEAFSEPPYRLMVELRFTPSASPNQEMVALQWWRVVLQVIRAVLESFYRTECTEYIPCLHCIRKGVDRSRVWLIPFQFVLQDLDKSDMYCNMIQSPSRCISRTEIAPDIIFCDLPQIDPKRTKVIQKIGKGGFGKVYAGTLDGNILVAIKELNRSVDSVTYQNFQTEAYIQSQIDHPNCVKLYGIATNPPRMIQQFVPGQDLSKILYNANSNDQNFPWDLRWQIAFDLISALQYLHSQSPPIIHRDVRSPNVFLTTEGRAILGDFGLARLVNPIVGGCLETWQWAAPECLGTQGGVYDESADIYSFGIVLYELATLQFPFKEYKGKYKNFKFEVTDNHLRPTFPPETPLAIVQIATRCWDGNPRLRPTARELYALLSKNQKNFQPEPIQSFTHAQIQPHLIRITHPQTQIDSAIARDSLQRSVGSVVAMIAVPTTSTVWIATSLGFIHVYELVNDRQCHLVHQWKAHESHISALALVEDSVWSAADTGVVSWNMSYATGMIPKAFRKKKNRVIPSQILFLRDSSTVWVASGRGAKILVLRPHDGKKLKTIRNSSMIGMINMAHHLNFVLVTNEGSVYIYHAQTCVLIGSFMAHSHGKVPTRILSSGGLVWTSSNSDIRLWNFPSADQVSLEMEIVLGDSKYECLQKFGKWVYTGSFKGELIVWDESTQTPCQEVIASTQAIRAICEMDHKIWCVSELSEVVVYNAFPLHPEISSHAEDQRNLYVSLRNDQLSSNYHQLVRFLIKPPVDGSVNGIELLENH